MHKKILETAIDLGVRVEDIEIYGHNVAKISKIGNKKGSKLVLVTAASPTPFGEGKTTISIALSDALNLLNEKACLSLREPSLGPVFGMKGGATGGGLSSLENAEKINLHFTGDFHAITSANNLIATVVDNHIYQGNVLDINKDQIYIKRCLDMNDRSLRNVELSSRKESFVITAASDMMAVFCMSNDLNDLRLRLGKMVIGKSNNGRYVELDELDCVDAVLSLLVDAIKPNLVNTLSGNPAFVHGGPFANIALGCSSVIATKSALSYADIVVTEAGFGSDLGAEKFIDIQSRVASLPVDCVVMVSTIKSIKYNAGDSTDPLRDGIKNLEKHVSNIKNVFNLPVVIALNVFPTDTSDEIQFVKNHFAEGYCKVAVCEPYTKGGGGAVDLAKDVLKILSTNKTEANNINYAYELDSSLKEKIESVAKKVYGAGSVKYSKVAEEEILSYEKSIYSKLPVCIAKTQYSLSGDSKSLGAPSGFCLNVERVTLNSGAGFFVVICGDIMTMPGLGKDSRYMRIRVSIDGEISGLM